MDRYVTYMLNFLDQTQKSMYDIQHVLLKHRRFNRKTKLLLSVFTIYAVLNEIRMAEYQERLDILSKEVKKMKDDALVEEIMGED